MALSDCPKCWETPCVCGYGYKSFEDHKVDEMIVQVPHNNLKWALDKSKGNTLYIIPREFLLKLIAYSEYPNTFKELRKIGIENIQS